LGFPVDFPVDFPDQSIGVIHGPRRSPWLSEAVIFFSVLLATVLMSDGRSHWLKGYLLMLAYTFIAASWQGG
jgi:hypothetical protein